MYMPCTGGLNMYAAFSPSQIENKAVQSIHNLGPFLSSSATTYVNYETRYKFLRSTTLTISYTYGILF